MTADRPIGYLVLDPGRSDSFRIPLIDRIFIGRECPGVDDSRRILLDDDLGISRNHAEIRIETDSSMPLLVDTSSNGTRVNGVRIARAASVPLSSGDRIQVGNHVLEFRSETSVTRGAEHVVPSSTITFDGPAPMALVVSDLVNFSTVSEQADQQVLARDVDSLYRDLRELLPPYKGILLDYMGDAFFAGWELDVDPEGVDHALGFALAAAKRVPDSTAAFELRYADGTPLRMGWAVTTGSVVVRLMPGSVVMALGDAVNVAFRISSISGREGRPEILATQAVRDAARRAWAFGPPETVAVKGRVGMETIYGVFAE